MAQAVSRTFKAYRVAVCKADMLGAVHSIEGDAMPADNSLPIILTVVAAHFLALISPGPDFLLVVRSALRNTPRHALGVALGIALANGIYIALCILGVAAVLAHSLWLMTVLKIAGGLFLLYVAFHALRARRSDYAFISAPGAAHDATALQTAPSFTREFALGMLSGLSNPKNILFYLSLFSVVLTPQVGNGFRIGLGLWMTALVFLWDAAIILVLSQQRVRRAFGRLAFYLDKMAGALLGLMGAKLLHSVAHAQR
ncbi:LysE family transporter [Vandammella animalimorsus]|nr:LysE family transporter [Vandammella animalimorsus]